jgi:Lrp/AsnC family leucine-responsive transcriptional regulator
MDAIDRRLLELLREDASRPLKTLAAEVALSRSSVRDRIARLLSRGIIRRYTIEVAPEALPVAAVCLLRLARTPDLVVVRAVAAMPEVTRCEALSGEIDLLVEVAAAHGPALNAVRDRIAALPGVLEVTTSLVLADYMPRG